MQELSCAFSETERVQAVYNEAIAYRCREGAPTVAHAIDRRCLYNFATALKGDSIQEPICFVCACTYPYMAHRASEGKFTDIHWLKPFQRAQGQP
eukprot:1293470-Karenia_brevis.AAC.1